MSDGQKTVELNIPHSAAERAQSKGGLKEKVALLASENGCLRAELSQTKRDPKDWQDSSEAYRHDAEKAEAQLNQACGREHDAKERCAELEKQCAELSGELEAVGIECKEAEAQLAKAKAEVTLLKEHVRCVINERELATELMRGAEAERDAMRTALRKIEQETIDHVAVRIARAARDHSQGGEG